MVRWEHRYLLGTMVFTIAGDVVRDRGAGRADIWLCFWRHPDFGQSPVPQPVFQPARVSGDYPFGP